MPMLKNITGKVFGRLTILSRVENNQHGQARFNCLCKCGSTKLVNYGELKSGDTKSCGCLRRETTKKRSIKHGLSGANATREYRIWKHMTQRTTNPNHPKAHRYGGRGIKVCQRWMVFTNFLADMGECPPGLSIDRIDNNGNYEPGNCRWATTKTQSRNKRNNTFWEHDGRRLCIAEWAEVTGHPSGRLWDRVYKHGWSIEKALTTPVRVRG